MNLLALTKLAWDLEHEPGLLDRYRADAGPVLAGYRLDDAARQAVLDRDAHALLAGGLNPVALRNLLVLLGIPHADLYRGDHRSA
ncbi:hypothetical protein [Blastococcus haudaquaticus]|uniref:Aromatic-ring-opening dioxygenase LigAB, LigA subunit n=1 Tax=Blastococcus haudaquaticus TaxID=1938745 RepID=A0A286GWF3_9ACTN|nr:hypothetical protein [Blastococcus haudaquaticus]SOD99409.1 Aromatic-ring-opening dioxygenase LigAB, LigA subunit [Blastococcus haudaquaticus]